MTEILKIVLFAICILITFLTLFMYLYLTFNVYMEEAKVFWWTIKFAIVPAMILAYFLYPILYDLGKQHNIDNLLTFGFDKWIKNKNYHKRTKIFIWFYLVLNFTYFFPYFILFTNQIFGQHKMQKINSLIMNVDYTKRGKSHDMCYIYVKETKTGICLLSDKMYDPYDEFNETLKVGYWGLYYK